MELIAPTHEGEKQITLPSIVSTATGMDLRALRKQGVGASPASSLPNEILVMIFLIGCQTQRTTSTEMAQKFEVCVSHVTRHWRYVALGTPALWTKITSVQYQRMLDPISAYLQRSNPLPFDFKLDIASDAYGMVAQEGSDGEDSSETKRDIGPSLRLIQPHLERCRRLFVHSGDYAESVKLLRFLSPVGTSSLQSIKLTFNLGVRSSGPLQIFQGGVPALAHLYLAGLSLGACKPASLSSLTALRLGRCTWPSDPTESLNLNKALSSMPLLSYLQLAASSHRCPQPFPLIHLPKLRTLVFVTSNTTSFTIAHFGQPLSARNISDFLLALDAPLLEDVTFEVSSGSWVSNLDDALIVHCLAKLPSVRRLCLNGQFNHIGPHDLNMQKLALSFPLLTTLCYSMGFALERTERLREFCAFLQEVDPSRGGVWHCMSTLQLLPIKPVGYHIDRAAFDLPIDDLKGIFVYRANAGYPIRILELPEDYFEQGPLLALCTEPPVQVLQCTYARPSDLPEW